MIEELRVVVNELYKAKCEAIENAVKCGAFSGSGNPAHIERSMWEAHAYSHAIGLLNDLIDKHEGVEGD